MEDGARYQRAIAVGILDGFATRFASELRAFKGVHRAEEEVAKLLAEQAGQAGEFIL